MYFPRRSSRELPTQVPDCSLHPPDGTADVRWLCMRAACLSRFDAWLRGAFPGSFPPQGYVFDYRLDVAAACWVPFDKPGSKPAVRQASDVPRLATLIPKP